MLIVVINNIFLICHYSYFQLRRPTDFISVSNFMCPIQTSYKKNTPGKIKLKPNKFSWKVKYKY